MTRLATAVVGLVVTALLGAGCGGTGSQGTGSGGNCVSAPSGLMSSGKLTVGSDISYPPQEFMDKNQPTGFDVDLGNALADKMCLKGEWVNQGFDGIIPALNAKKFDLIISAMTINDDRKKVVDFVPYFVAGESIVVKKGSNLKFNDLTALCGHKVAVEKGTAEADEIKTITCTGKPIEASEYPVDTEALQQLNKGTVDAHFTDSPVAEYEVKQNASFEIASPVLESAPEGIAVRKNESSMLTAIQSALEAIEKDGTYDKLLKKWGVQDGDIRKAT